MSKSKRIKVQLGRTITKNEVESMVGAIALMKNAERKVQADLDAAILKANEQCGPVLMEINATIAHSMAQLQQWAKENPQEFDPKKSISFPSGTIGFRTGTPKVETTHRKTWKAVLELLDESGGAFDGYIREKPEVDKDAILKDFAEKFIDNEFLKDVFLKVVQDETFFIEPNLTETETRVSAPAKGVA